MSNPFEAGRYHSLIAERERLPGELEVTAWTPEGEVMGVRHRQLGVEGVQFHPESILTPEGPRLMAAFLRCGDRMALSQLVIAAALVTADFCADPIEGGVGDPQFCSFAIAREVSTPYFSIVVEAGFLVGLNREGRKLQVQSILFKNHDTLTIEVLDGPSPPAWSDCPTIEEFEESGVMWKDCRTASNGQYTRRLTAALSDRHVLIEYSYSSLATNLAPALERMTQSIKVVAN